MNVSVLKPTHLLLLRLCGLLVCGSRLDTNLGISKSLVSHRMLDNGFFPSAQRALSEMRQRIGDVLRSKSGMVTSCAKSD